ncbi:MAG TPA: DUF2069 domain-containing protein [Oxalicibacterium sp.]|jgi:uncharacterized membrane protein|nr:DUF2069 domain-containing protein [Oxalicibacterium sp.]
MNEARQRFLHMGAVGALLALIALGIAWEWALAPLRPGGSWLVLKIVPLLLPLRGIWKRDLYTMQWASMLILLYLAEGVVRGLSDRGLSSTLGWIETALTLLFFFCVVSFIRPYKKAAKALAKKALQKAAE